MSALSKSAILHELMQGTLAVSPLLNDKQIGPSSIDLRMGTLALVARAGQNSHVDPSAYIKSASAHQRVQGLKQKHQRIDVPFGKSLLLHPGSLALVPTLEWVVIPQNLQGIVTARSSWAREGLNIASASIINPKYRGIITLELANFGEIPISLRPGLRIAQLALYELQRKDPYADDAPDESRQFDMSFEPEPGDLAKLDEPFLKED
jgi:dCTP deaminase